MGRCVHLLLVLALATGFAPASEAGELADQLTSYALTDLEGQQHSLADNRGEVVVVNFWAAWCAPCLKELPILDDWHAEWLPQGARIAAISVDSNEKKARRFVEQSGLGLDVYLDGPEGLAKQIDLPSLPCTYVLDREGRVVLTTRSSSKEDLALVQSTVRQLLAEKPSVDTAAMGGTR